MSNENAKPLDAGALMGCDHPDSAPYIASLHARAEKAEARVAEAEVLAKKLVEANGRTFDQLTAAEAKAERLEAALRHIDAILNGTCTRFPNEERTCLSTGIDPTSDGKCTPCIVRAALEAKP